MRIRSRDSGKGRPLISRRRAKRAVPLEPAESAVAAIRRAEEAAAARLAAETAERAEVDAARRQAAELLAAASRRAAELAGQRRQLVRAAVDADVEHEHADGAAKLDQLRCAILARHTVAVELAVALVLTGEEGPC
jgi:hypothetical protein